jgi:hypothetical protein
MRSTRILTAALSALLLACSGSSPSEPAPGRVSLTVKVAPTSVASGERLEVILTAENHGREAAHLQFGGCQSSFFITRDGAVVYDLKSLMLCAAVVTSLVLEPGESASFRHVWRQRDTDLPGQYEAHGELLMQPSSLVSAPVPFTIRAGG